jgi:DNA-directed RNA polymerase subunit alpha
MPQHPLNPVLLRKTDEVGLSERATMCLTDANIVYIGDLVQMSEGELMRQPHIGPTTLREIKAMLAGLGLHLTMQVPGWPPENIGR